MNEREQKKLHVGMKQSLSCPYSTASKLALELITEMANLAKGNKTWFLDELDCFEYQSSIPRS